ncbi:hypothetical protein G9G54_14090 [Paenibacillus sp. EKM212P]|uniref:hypothetical protein n=1 Tax=Paenibacillus sp. EKM212P TaxID=1683680 RepID=UPI0013ECADAE|nr:hypothetical protein [Paenibacillus sp. EKM212P]KAF6578397.1 hypothetical protein G9G54_14090 [Paenibacillus sp. EKM212P]
MGNNIKLKVDIAISNLLEFDQYLLSHDLNERTIAHKLAVYLQEEFNEYNVDCEYNKNVEEESKKKMIYILEQECQEIKRKFNKDIFVDDIEYMGLSTFPDIVIHKRGENTSNLLIIEIKKSTNSIDRGFDFQKLKCYTDNSRYNNLSYAWGLFIEFETGKKSPKRPELIWYKDGQIIKVSHYR